MPDIGGVVNEGSAGVHIFVVGEAGADAGALLDVDMVSRGDVGADVVRGQAHPVFIVLDLFDAADLHLCFLLQYVMQIIRPGYGRL